MKRDSHRRTKANEARTQKVKETYQATKDLLKTWEQMSDEVQIKNYDYLLKLRAKERRFRGYLAHRAYCDL